MEASERSRTTTVLLSLWWLAFAASVLQTQDVEQALEHAAAADTQSGNLYNQVLIFSFAALGGRYVPVALDRCKGKLWQSLILLWILYVAWALASVLWSEDPFISVRRLVVFVAVTIGCFGLGAGWYGTMKDGVRRVGSDFLFSAVGSVVLMVAFGLLRGNFATMMDPDWSLKNTVRASHYIYYGGLASLASLVLFRRHSMRIAGFLAWFVFLLLLKGRTVLVSTLATACLMYAGTIENRLVRGALMTCGVLGAAFVIDLGTGGFVVRNMTALVQDSAWVDYATLGEGADNFQNLSGRVPLWDYLWGISSAAPIQGYGFGAFWTGSRIEDVLAHVGWPAVAAHNGYLDELLATGVVGLLLTCGFWLVSLIVTRSDHDRDQVSGCMVFGWLCLFLLFNLMDSTFQFCFQVPTLAALTGLFALVARQSVSSEDLADAAARLPELQQVGH